MNDVEEFQIGCSEEFATLCGLSTSGELCAEEVATLEDHVSRCAPCAALLREYVSLAHVGLSKLAVEYDRELQTPFGYNESEAEERFVASFHEELEIRRKSRHRRALLSFGDFSWGQLKRPAFILGVAAVFLSICSAFELGRRMSAPQPGLTTASRVESTLPTFDADKLKLGAELATANSSLKAITAKSDDLEERLAALSDVKTSLDARIAELSQRNTSDSMLMASMTQQLDGLQKQLNDSSSALLNAKEDLNRAQQDRRGQLLRVAALETEADELHKELAAKSNSDTGNEKLLAADRDIRELMGARQLYIADVFDVQNNGERSKPFGRVFYTKGKSLIFYAFDLEKQPGYHDAKAFQAWGKLDDASAKPVSLGILYMDNEQNRRWVVRSSDQNVLARINTVFVTVEPNGGSQKPTGKPFLEAYLHSLPPNHP